MRAALATAGIAIVCVVVFAVVRSDSDDEEAAPEQPPPAETADPLPPLPAGWGKAANAEAGFVLGVPSGWSQNSGGASTTLKSPGSSVVIRVTADRSAEAIDSNLDEYAAALLARLGPAAAASGQAADASGLRAAAGYQHASASGQGAPEDGSGDRLQVVVIRRPELAAFPILIASDAGVKPAELEPIVARVVSSLRGRPTG